MTIRLDKCVTFGLKKSDNTFAQYQPALFISNEKIPSVPSGESFVYLGKIFDSDMKNEEAKTKVVDKLKNLLRITSSLNISTQMKLQILRRYIHTKLSFELRIYNFGATWIDQCLDSVCFEHMRKWLQLPVDSCLKELAVISKSSCGLGIPSFKNLSERLLVKKRHRMLHNTQPEMQQIWKDTSYLHTVVDSLLLHDQSAAAASNSMREIQDEKAESHILSLVVQGRAVKTIRETISRQNIVSWSAVLDSLPQHLFTFARKALIQQLPTASNLFKWKKIAKPECCLCNRVQSNKHVLANCSAPTSLERYTRRHNNVLLLIATWLRSVKSDGQELYVDFPSTEWNPVVTIFQPSCRPDIVLVERSKISTLELTIFHETNLEKSRQFKMNKYENIRDHLQPHLTLSTVNTFSIEVSTLGFISNIQDFRKSMKLPKLPKTILNSMIKSALSDSYSIYCLRNSAD